MITFVNNNNNIALIINANDNKSVVGVYDSWAAFRNGSQPMQTHVFNGINNYSAIEEFFNGWSKVCRNDSTWEIELCGQNPQPVVPGSISARQIRLWLISNNISLSQIDQLIDNIPDAQQREYTRVEWEFAPYIERNHQMVQTFANALGLTQSQVDQAFIQASNI